ncbi:MAG: HD-GYP domain-containing protein [Syntrophales bacterium]|nr:HD-GYP domain-containing protein [Syntrophales bacterium]
MKASDLAKGILKKSEKEPAVMDEGQKEEETKPLPEEVSEEKPKRKMPAFRLSDLGILDLPIDDSVQAKTVSPRMDVEPKSDAEAEVAGEKEMATPKDISPTEVKRGSSFRLSDLMVEEKPAPTSVGEVPHEEILLTPETEKMENLTREDEVEEKEPIRQEEEKSVSPMAITIAETIDASYLYTIAKVYLSDLKERVRKGLSIDIRPVAEVMGRLIKENLVTDEITQGIARLSGAEEYYVSHAVNTAAYAVRVGRGLGYEFEELRELAMAGFLCDIGLFKIPEDILNKQGHLSSQEVNLIKSHTEIAVELLAPVATTYPLMIRAIREHHERENGQGYPKGLKGEEISEFAKIIGICDSYVAMTHNRPHKKALIQTETIRELISMKGNFFSAKIIKAFLDEISIFPVGSYVVLNNRMIGEVVATNRYSPFKPTVKIIFDEHGRKLDSPREVDLMKNPILNIESNISFEDLPKEGS